MRNKIYRAVFLILALFILVSGISIETRAETEQSASISSNPSLIFRVGDQNYYINGEPKESHEPAFFQFDHLYISLRDVSDAIGAELTWDFNTTIMTKDNVKLVTTCFVSAILVSIDGNERIFDIDGEPSRSDDRICLPYQSVLPYFGYSCIYDANSQSIFCEETV
ncbi:MAG: stalk domain-containing protein [Clostridiales bacterium]